MSGPIFYPGLHQPSDANHFERACISINRLRTRAKPLGCADVLVDSAAFTELAQHGCYRHAPADYANALRRLAGVVNISAAVAQDYMCEPFMLAKTGLSVGEHQRLTIVRYDALVAERLPFPILPVLQGYQPSEYAAHLAAYGDRLAPGMWVGVGSVCKRNGTPEGVLAVLLAIKAERPDLRLHAFGLKTTSLTHQGVREMIYSADSMAWSLAARKQGGDANDWRQAQAFCASIANIRPYPWQLSLF